ncbi:PREDICTED: rust resistance kinase Lr10 [Theobroma cacao]|uniref:Rust resistance kinase Lr10 n=1 Tax=Theobroma cacao TaxID=3641 RepID=A0AB32VWI6_THECC|nr:PREDICTED: rust resistance kinase Lr10 [Theobroma cacao]
MAAVSLLVLIVLSQFVLLHFAGAEEENSYQHRRDCPTFPCGKLGEIGFPYTPRDRPECGLFVVGGCEGNIQKVQLKQGERWYQVDSISQAGTVTIYDEVLAKQLETKDCESLKNLSLSFPNLPYVTFQILSNLTLCKCNSPLNTSKMQEFSYAKCKNSTIYYSQPQGMPKPPDEDQYDRLSSLCNCPIIELPFTHLPPDKKHNSHLFRMLTAKVTVGVTVSLVALSLSHSFPTPFLGALASGIGVWIILAICFRIKCSSRDRMFFVRKKQDHQKIEALLKEYGSFAPKRYTYSDIKKMTNSFRKKLGQGGYGGVYKGELLDGRLVAVKVLDESKGNGEEFINEVASISRTSHINIVTLLGFCFEGRKRALIYEFVPNGSLEKFIYQNNPLEEDRQLEWETLYQIALGIGRGLEYLHRGCNTRILHFDIKPHNILLDNNFCPKISDFGLAKLCPRNESIISMTGARGTAGYIAPEVFCRAFGGVSHKSDVYSFGMMVLEMVGGRRNINVEADRTSDIYFPRWISQRLESEEELKLWGITREDDKQQATKMILLSLWCIQTDPSNRPQMSRVLEMLEGSLESLSIPPKPFLSSPPR